MLRTVLGAWTPENQNSVIAQMKPLGVGYDTNSDTHRLKDGSFIRGKNISLSYTFPSDKIAGKVLKGLSLSANAQNLFLITSFPGYDPEVSTSTASFQRGVAAYFEYPAPRTFSVGAQVNF